MSVESNGEDGMVFFDPTWEWYWRVWDRMPSWSQKDDFSLNGMEYEDWLTPKLFHTLKKGPDKWAVVYPVTVEVSEPLTVSWFDSEQEAKSFCDKQIKEWEEWADKQNEEEG